MTADEIVCADVHKVFQQITGMGKKIHPDLLIHAPFNLRKSLIKLIAAEKLAALEGKPARILAKLNSLTDPAIIKELYAASQAGVQIDLIVRGISCLKTGIPEVSENIRVVSVVGRFLEHSRVYYFLNGSHQVYCASADWMERNLSNRIEVCFPILKKKHAARIMKEMELHLNDVGQSWELMADGSYKGRGIESAKSDDVQLKLLRQLSQS
jgi:polyphosphate kinase